MTIKLHIYFIIYYHFLHFRSYLILYIYFVLIARIIANESTVVRRRYCIREAFGWMENKPTLFTRSVFGKPGYASADHFRAFVLERFVYGYRKRCANNHIYISQIEYGKIFVVKLCHKNAYSIHVHLQKLCIAELFAAAKILWVSYEGVNIWCNQL